MIEKTVSIPFKILLQTENGVPTAYAYDDELSHLAHGRSPQDAARNLKAKIQTTVREALRAQAHDNAKQLLIMSSQGSAFIVHFKNDAWQYSIAHNGTGHASGCIGFDTYEKAAQRAREHASDDVFGPVLWECRF